MRSCLNPKISVSVVFIAAMFMSIMDTTIVNVALPSLGRQFGVSSTSIEVVVISYLVSLATIIPVSGWLGDRWGTRRTFLLAFLLFVIASALCGLSVNLPMLVGFRMLQGLAGGALTPVGTAILYRTFPPAQRVQVSRVLIIPTIIAPASGPVLGGLLIDQLSWRWVFFVNVPIGIAACLFGLIFLQEHREPAAGRFDLAGFFLGGAGLALFMYALSEGPSYGWTSPGILASALAGILLLGAFVVVERRAREPMIDLHLLGDRSFRTANVVCLFGSAGFLGVLFAAPLFLQEGRGITALESGLTTFPEALGVVVSTQFVAWLYPRVGPRRLMAVGLTGQAIVIALLCLVGQDTSLWLMRLLMFLIGAGLAFLNIPVQAVAFVTIAPSDTGRASALYSAQRQLGSAFGVAVVSTVISLAGPTLLSGSGVVQPNLTAYHLAFLAAAVLVLVAVGASLTISDRDAAITMRRKSPADSELEVVSH